MHGFGVNLIKKISIALAILFTGVGAGAQSSQPAVAEKAKAALSSTQGTLKVRGLQQPVTVLRDRWGVAHIYAQNQHDLFFAQGFVAAQDRLFQMELWKRSGQGRLAEILGPSALWRDVNARLLRYRGDMAAEYASYSPDTQQILQAFTDGINAFIAERSRAGGQGLPLEFQLAGFAPEPWKPEDCLNRMAAFSMTGNAFSELAHAQAVAAIGPEKASQLFDLNPRVMLDPAPGVDFAGLSPALLRNLVGSDARIEFPTYYIEGSNNWTVSGQLTATGKPLLANDPHRVIAVPSLRYMVHLVAPGWDVIGAGEPGLPGVALGHNQQIAWGFTIFGSDQQDLYLEEINSANPLEYRTARGWERMQVEKENFVVRGGPSVTVELKFTRHGPVLWQDRNRALALRFVGAGPGTAGYLGSLAVDRAQNWDQFESAMARWKVPSENIVYADHEGNIGEHSVGLSPIRKNWTGLLPVPGAGRYEWSGFIPVKQLPHLYNPAKGFVATANHKMIPENYPYNIGFEWYPPYRFGRVTEVLEQARASGHKLTVEDFERLQNDVVSLPARELVALLRQAVGDQPTTTEKILLSWDTALTRDSDPASLYEFTMQNLRTSIVQLIAPKQLWDIARDWEPSVPLRLLSRPAPDVFGAKPETRRNRILRDAVQAAATQLTKMRGPDPANWTWGQLHQVRLRHPLDRAPGAEGLMDPQSLSRPGDQDTVMATGYHDESLDQVSGASYREILDTSNWDSSVAINAPGQSGQPGSPHYSDLLPLWNDGQYFPLAYSRAAVEQVATDKLVLEP